MRQLALIVTAAAAAALVAPSPAAADPHPRTHGAGCRIHSTVHKLWTTGCPRGTAASTDGLPCGPASAAGVYVIVDGRCQYVPR